MSTLTNLQDKLKQQLVELQSNMLHYAFILTINKENAKSLRQEANLKVLDNLEKYKNDINFKGWVHKIMYNTFVNNYRQNTYEKSIIKSVNDFFSLSYDSEFESPESAYSFSEIIKAINSLSENKNKIFLMYISGYKYEEIAQAQKLPLGTVKSCIHIVRKELQKGLIDYR